MNILADYQGRSVRLTEERKAHILARAEMAGMEAALRAVLRDPQLVISSRSDETVALFYRYCAGTVVGDKWLCVVVKYEEKDGFVLTAYLTDRPKTGEKLWPGE